MSKKHYRPTNDIQGQKASIDPIDETSKLSETDKEIITEQQQVDETETKVETVVGVVTDCLKLRVRKQPNTASEIVCEIDALSEVQINESKSTEEFYKIITSAGVEGYCMKKFIAVKQ